MFTIILTVCDAEYNVIFVDIGAYGLQSDSGVLQNSEPEKNFLKLLKFT